jgi:hypothetical protein
MCCVCIVAVDDRATVIHREVHVSLRYSPVAMLTWEYTDPHTNDVECVLEARELGSPPPHRYNHTQPFSNLISVVLVTVI